MPDVIATGFGIALVILSFGAVRWMTIYLRNLPTAADTGLEELGQRLEVIEGRLRDITDVMISVSEKSIAWRKYGPNRSHLHGRGSYEWILCGR